MNRSIRRMSAISALVLGGVAYGCHDSDVATQSVGSSMTKSITPRAIVATAGNMATITLALDVGGDVGKIGSFTGRLRFDPAGLTFVGQDQIEDGTLRAANVVGGEIRVAGASARGVDVATLATLRFTVTNAQALKVVTFDLDEVHELARTDLRASLRRSSGPRFAQ